MLVTGVGFGFGDGALAAQNIVNNPTGLHTNADTIAGTIQSLIAGSANSYTLQQQQQFGAFMSRTTASPTPVFSANSLGPELIVGTAGAWSCVGRCTGFESFL